MLKLHQYKKISKNVLLLSLTHWVSCSSAARQNTLSPETEACMPA